MKDIGRLAAIAAAAAITLGGCSGGDSGKAAEAQTDDAASQNRELLNAVKRPLDRAHEVEDISAARKGELDKQIETAE
jgi:hypothetical protein